MRSFLLRILILLISANVAYGTSGDFYAEEIQELFPSEGIRYTYKPEINSELFHSSRHKEEKKTSLEEDKTNAELKFWDSFQLIAVPRSVGFEIGDICLHNSDSNFYLLNLRKIIFPRHFFF